MLRPYTKDLSPAQRVRLLVKYLMYPGTNWVSRDKSRVVRMFLTGTADRPIRTLDCGCGNGYFAAPGHPAPCAVPGDHDPFLGEAQL